MFDIGSTAEFTLTNARIVLSDRVLEGSLRIEDGVIAEIFEGAAEGLDCAGDIILPGIVDLHTDHVESHVFPRAGVQWDFTRAVLAHDAQIIGAGITTVFDSLSVGASMKRPERREILGPLIDAIESAQAQGLLRAEHFLHMRCEISDPETMGLVDANMGRPITRLASVMDHTPGDRQSIDIEHWLNRMIAEMRIDRREGEARLAELLARSARVGAEVRAHVVRAAAAHELPLMIHDDRTEHQVDQARDEGIAISEFPTTLAAARRARMHGMTIVAGAPNYLRGGSQSGNVGLRELLAEGLVDILASDYVPRSLLDAVFAIADDPALPQALPEAAAMVSARPAEAAGLTDRGRIAPGQRADLLRVARPGAQCHLRGVWRAGRRLL